MSDFSNKLREYARQLVCLGVNIQPGETLVIYSPVECAQLVRLCTEEAYAAQCGEVIVGWKDDFIERERFLHADETVFGRYPESERIIYEAAANPGTCLLEFYSVNPHNLDGVEPGRIVAARRAKMEAVAPYYSLLERGNGIRCTASPPIEATAGLTFPNLSLDEAAAAQWGRVFRALKIDGESDSIAAWTKYLELVELRCEKLNSFQLRSLQYKNTLGTDFELLLPESSIWTTARGLKKNGKPYMMNFPSEEIYTVPEKFGINGSVCASIPLVYQGSLIENMRLEFTGGRVVKAEASSGLEQLEALLSVDEGARYLGEVALVPADSSIRGEGGPWFNPLYDENSSCHLALGAAISSCYDKARDSCNSSAIHIDFMIGTDDMCVTGKTASGEEIPILRDGKYVI